MGGREGFKESGPIHMTQGRKAVSEAARVALSASHLFQPLGARGSMSNGTTRRSYRWRYAHCEVDCRGMGAKIRRDSGASVHWMA